MSGGSYDYTFHRIDDLADEVELRAKTALRKAFANHLRLVAKAAHDIEWVDSGDYGDGDEEAAIRAVITPAVEMQSARAELEAAIVNASELLQREVRS